MSGEGLTTDEPRVAGFHRRRSGRSESSGMPEIELPLALWILVGTNLIFILLIWMGQLKASGRLSRIEQQLGKVASGSGGSGRAEATGKADDHEQYLIFQKFLDEDPARNGLAKKEQFAEFRKWRKEKGLNWNA